MLLKRTISILARLNTSPRHMHWILKIHEHSILHCGWQSDANSCKIRSGWSRTVAKLSFSMQRHIIDVVYVNTMIYSADICMSCWLLWIFIFKCVIHLNAVHHLNKCHFSIGSNNPNLDDSFWNPISII